MKSNYSIREAILEQMQGRSQVNKVLAERHAAINGVNAVNDAILLNVETRAALTAKDNPNTQEEGRGLLLPLDNNLVFERAGATIMTGLTQPVFFGKHTTPTVTWEGENAAAKDGAGTFSKSNTFSPKRITAWVDISKQLLAQDNNGVEEYLKNLLSATVIQKVEATALGTSLGVENVPDGIFAEYVSLGALTWPSIVAMEKQADLANALQGNLAYITHPALYGKAQITTKDASGAGGFIAGTGFNGYNTFRTNNIASSLGGTIDEELGVLVGNDEYGIIFGNWADYFIGQWGMVELIADQYSFATTGMVRLTLNSYWDMGFIRSESFAYGSMK